MQWVVHTQLVTNENGDIEIFDRAKREGFAGRNIQIRPCRMISFKDGPAEEQHIMKFLQASWKSLKERPLERQASWKSLPCRGTIFI